MVTAGLIVQLLDLIYGVAERPSQPLPAAVFRLLPSLWMGELTSVSYFWDSSQRGASSSSYTCEQFLLFSQWQSRVGTPCPLVLQLDQACEGQQLLPAGSSDHCWPPFHDL